MDMNIKSILRFVFASKFMLAMVTSVHAANLSAPFSNTLCQDSSGILQ